MQTPSKAANGNGLASPGGNSAKKRQRTLEEYSSSSTHASPVKSPSPKQPSSKKQKGYQQVATPRPIKQFKASGRATNLIANSSDANKPNTPTGASTPTTKKQNNPNALEDHIFEHGIPQIKMVKYSAEELKKQRTSLPIYPAREPLIEEFKNHPTLIVVGETGSGKTTQIPQYLFEGGFATDGKAICVTQPRRVAAITVATRVADEMGCVLGKEVGYTIRFEDCTCEDTKIKYMTDGMLLRELQIDPMLSRYSVIVLDEAHERTLHTDVLFSVVKGIQQKRKDLRIIVMSATLEAEAFARYFNNAKIVYVEGRQHPVEIFYTEEPQADYRDAALTACLQTHLECGDEEGDILVFLTGQEEIESVAALLEAKAKKLPPEAKKLIVCPIFSALPQEQQMLVFQKTPKGCRKAILATNIAETSITINGIKYVIDTGMGKFRDYNARIGLEALMTGVISKASANQRAGRAGRETSGKCYRLYTEEDYEKMAPFAVPEIQRCNLSTVVLQLKSMGIEDVINFDFMDKPSTVALKKAHETLYILGALDENNKLTEFGMRMAQFPLDPMFSRALLMSEEFGCAEEMLIIVAMLSVENIFYLPQNQREKANRAHARFASIYGDHLTMLNVFRAYMEYGCDPKWCKDNFINAKSMQRVKKVRLQLAEYLYNALVAHKNSNNNNSSNNNKAATPSKKINKVNLAEYKFSSCGLNTDAVRRALTAGFFSNVAVRVSFMTYRGFVDQQELALHPSCSLLFRIDSGTAKGKSSDETLPKYVIFNQKVFTSKKYIRDVCAIEDMWLPELAPKFFSRKASQDGTSSNNQQDKKKSEPQSIKSR